MKAVAIELVLTMEGRLENLSYDKEIGLCRLPQVAFRSKIIIISDDGTRSSEIEGEHIELGEEEFNVLKLKLAQIVQRLLDTRSEVFA